MRGDEPRKQSIVELHPQAMTDQARRHGVEDFVQDEAAARRHLDQSFFMIRRAPLRQRPQL
jgi:hypothetical protein